MSPPANNTGEMVRIAAASNPLTTDIADYLLPQGSTIEELLAIVQADPVLRDHAHVFIGDRYVARELWGMVKPRAGTLVSVRVFPRGGDGKNPLRTILTIGVLAAAFFAGPALGAALGFSQSAGVFGLATATPFGAALGTGIILVGGTILTNVIAPLPDQSSQNQKESPSYFIDQARNRARPYQPIPTVLGKHRHVPPLAATVYTEVVGDTNHIRMLVAWGFGPLKIENLRIGDTALTEFTDYQVETVEGRASDDPITLYPDDVDQQNLSIVLTNADGWVTRTSAQDADELSVDITLPQGIAQFNDRGERTTHSVTIDIQYRETGTSGTWLTPDISGLNNPNPPLDPDTYGLVTAATFDSDWFVGAGVPSTTNYGQINISGSRNQPVRHGYRWTLPERGQYDVRLRRISADATEDGVFDQTVWSALRSFTDRPPISFPKPLALTALVIKATDQLNRAVDELNADVTSYVLDWDSGNSTWTERESSNPASMFRHVLQGPARSRPVTDAEIDLDALQEFHEFCETNSYEFNHVIDYQKSIWNTLSDICSVARASPQWKDGKWTVVVDTGDQLPVQHFSPRNSSGFRMTRAFDDPPDALRVRFPNRNEGWRLDERTVYRDDRDADNAQVFATVEAVGITDPDHIYKYARFQLAQILLRREAWTVTVDAEHLVARRGSRVTLTHDVLLIGLASARIKKIDSSSGIVIDIDEEVTMTAGTDYGIVVRTPMDAKVSSQVSTVAGDTRQLTLQSPPADFLTKVSVGDLLAFGEFGRETVDALVSSVQPAGDLSARVLMAPFSEGVYQAETGNIPPYDTHITGLLELPDIVILSIYSDASDLNSRRITPRIVLEIRTEGVIGGFFDVQIRGNGTGEPYANAAVISQTLEAVQIGDVSEGQSYDVRIRWNSVSALIPGEWTEQLNHAVNLYPRPGAGEDGEDGIGFEYIFVSSTDGAAITATADLPVATWPYDQAALTAGLTRGTQTYYDGSPPDISEMRPYRIRFWRRVPGSPDAESALNSAWTQDRAVRVFGTQGLDGEEGVGVEYIFTSSTDGATITNAADLPLGTWHYDAPGLANGITRGNFTYYDGNPTNLSATRPWRIRFRRPVPGSPAQDDDIGDVTWIQEKAYQAWGREGEDGEEGIGVEYIFTSSVNGIAITEAGDLPLGTWNYDRPALANGITRGDHTYYDGTPGDISDTRPFQIRFRRAVPGSPAQDDDIGNVAWTQDPAIRVLGKDAVFFQQSVIEVPIRAIGGQISTATGFSPNPATVVMTLVSGTTQTDVTVEGTVSADGVVVVLSGANMNDFEIVT